MLGRILGRGPVGWWRCGAHLNARDLHAVPPLLCCARSVRNRARGVQVAVLQTAAPGGWKFFGRRFVLKNRGEGFVQGTAGK